MPAVMVLVLSSRDGSFHVAFPGHAGRYRSRSLRSLAASRRSHRCGRSLAGARIGESRPPVMVRSRPRRPVWSLAPGALARSHRRGRPPVMVRSPATQAGCGRSLAGARSLASERVVRQSWCVPATGRRSRSLAGARSLASERVVRQTIDGHPFTAPLSSPDTSRRWMRAKNARLGIAASSEAAASWLSAPGLGTDEVGERQRQCLALGRLDQHQGEEELVPGGDEREQRRGNESWSQQRKDDAAQGM